MKKIVSLIMALVLSASLFTCVYAFEPEDYNGPDYLDNKITFWVANEYSYSDDIAFDGAFFGIEEIEYSEPNFPLEYALKFKDDTHYNRTYTATLNTHDEELIWDIIDELIKSEYVVDVAIVFSSPHKYDQSKFTEEQIEYLQNLALNCGLHYRFFHSYDGKLNFKSIADLGDNRLVFLACSEVHLDMENEVIIGNYCYTHGSISDEMHITINDNIYTLCDAFDKGLITNEDIQKIVDTKGTAFYPLGDTNKDKLIDILDVVYVRNFITKSNTYFYNFGSDINLDESLDILDVVIMRNKIVNG